MNSERTDAAIKANWTRDKEGGMTGSLRVSGKVALIMGALLGVGGTALGYFGHGEGGVKKPAPIVAAEDPELAELKRAFREHVRAEDERWKETNTTLHDIRRTHGISC